jgi:hypothetical protein
MTENPLYYKWIYVTNFQNELHSGGNVIAFSSSYYYYIITIIIIIIIMINIIIIGSGSNLDLKIL